MRSCEYYSHSRCRNLMKLWVRDPKVRLSKYHRVLGFVDWTMMSLLKSLDASWMYILFVNLKLSRQFELQRCHRRSQLPAERSVKVFCLFLTYLYKVNASNINLLLVNSSKNKWILILKPIFMGQCNENCPFNSLQWNNKLILLCGSLLNNLLTIFNCMKSPLATKDFFVRLLEITNSPHKMNWLSFWLLWLMISKWQKNKSLLKDWIKNIRI